MKYLNFLKNKGLSILAFAFIFVFTVNIAQGQTVSNGANYINSDNFISQVYVSQGTITQFSSSFNFKDIPPAPGPLPLAGLGIALGYSRKLRKRIAAS